MDMKRGEQRSQLTRSRRCRVHLFNISAFRTFEGLYLIAQDLIKSVWLWFNAAQGTIWVTLPSASLPWLRYCPMLRIKAASDTVYSTASDLPVLTCRRHRKFGITKTSFYSQS